MKLQLRDLDDVLFIGSLFLFYTHWLHDRRSAATEALQDAFAAHKAMGDERATALARQMQALINFAVEQETRDDQAAVAAAVTAHGEEAGD